MGKQRKPRRKFHESSKVNNSEKNLDSNVMDTTTPLLETSDNVFAGINIDFSSLQKKLNDDTKSVKSYKSLKSELAQDKPLSKKDKLQLRRQMFLKKLDMVNQMKKETKIRKKRKNLAVIGDTNPLHDALPSLESLLKLKNDIPYKANEKKVKGIEKASRQKKNLLHGMNVYKQIMKNKTFQKNPLGMISEHVKAIVDFEKTNFKK